MLTEVGAKPTAYLLDPSGAVGKAYDAKTTPHMFVIGKTGTLLYAGGIDDKPTPRPADIKGADLEKALANAEKAIADKTKKSDSGSIDACLAALKEVESAVGKTIKKECDKK